MADWGTGNAKHFSMARVALYQDAERVGLAMDIEHAG
jgi:hypothetical protein